VGGLAPRADAAIVAVTPEGREHRLASKNIPAGHRGGKGQKVVKRGGVVMLRLGS
jgi:hypothetical protein